MVLRLPRPSSALSQATTSRNTGSPRRTHRCCCCCCWPCLGMRRCPAPLATMTTTWPFSRSRGTGTREQPAGAAEVGVLLGMRHHSTPVTVAERDVQHDRYGPRRPRSCPYELHEPHAVRRALGRHGSTSAAAIYGRCTAPAPLLPCPHAGAGAVDDAHVIVHRLRSARRGRCSREVTCRTSSLEDPHQSSYRDVAAVAYTWLNTRPSSRPPPNSRHGHSFMNCRGREDRYAAGVD